MISEISLNYLSMYSSLLSLQVTTVSLNSAQNSRLLIAKRKFEARAQDFSISKRQVERLLFEISMKS